MAPVRSAKTQSVSTRAEQMTPVLILWPVLTSDVRTRAVFLVPAVETLCVNQKIIERSAVVRHLSVETLLPPVRDRTYLSSSDVQMIRNAVLALYASLEAVLRAVVMTISALQTRPVLTASAGIRANIRMRAESMLTVLQTLTDLSVRVIQDLLAIHMSNVDLFKMCANVFETRIAEIDWFAKILAVLLAVGIVRAVLSKNRVLTEFVKILAVCLVFVVVMPFADLSIIRPSVRVLQDLKAIRMSFALKLRRSVSKTANAFWAKFVKTLNVYLVVVSIIIVTKIAPAFTAVVRIHVYYRIVVELMLTVSHSITDLVVNVFRTIEETHLSNASPVCIDSIQLILKPLKLRILKMFIKS